MLKQSLALALAAATIAIPAHAAEVDRNSATVSYRDLDLTSEAGRKTLERRLQQAARDVCGMDERTTGTRVASRESQACYKEARKQLDRQFVEIVGNSRSGG